MFKKRNKNDVQTEYSCSVRFLDDEPMQFTFKKDTIGQWLFDRVAEKLNLMEKDYFGLRYVDSEKQRHWLDPLKTVYKQLKGVNPMVLCFRVKFYPEDPMKLHEEITRYYLFLQLRRDLHHGRLLCSPDDAVALAALIVQSEVGDYDPDDHPPGYISEFKMLPKQTPKLEERVMDQHKLLHGLVPSDAEANFLKKACTLDTYGVDPHQVKDQKGDQLYLGITHQGIMTFRGSRRTQLYKWAQIRRIAYEGKMFVVHVNVNEDDEAGTTKKGNFSWRKQQPVGYKCQTSAASKYLWRCAVEQQLFFTLSNSTAAPKKLRSGGTIFTRGSKFRFSGRCQNEAYEASEHIHRTEPNFQRSSSLPNFARRHPSLGSRNSGVNKRESSLSDTQPEDRRRYNVIWAPGKKPEAAVDVLGLPDNKPAAEVEPSPVVKAPSSKAPMAAPENFDDQQQQQPEQTPVEEVMFAANTATATAAPKLNGQAVVVEPGRPPGGEADVSFDTGAYQPNNTFYDDDDDDDDEGPKTSLEEEIKQLDASFDSASNHVPDLIPPITTTTAVPATAASVTSSTTVVQKKSPSRCATCGAVTGSVLIVLGIFGTLFYLLYFSGLEHPYLTEARNHLKFLEPSRDFVAKQAEVVARYFRK